jgi:TonB-linked SusC/RagA family outer membrane protein
MRNKLLFASLLTILISTFSFAQDINVSGRVTDEKGTGIPGATIMVKATKKATITNDNGDFTISARKGAVITVSYVGYLSKDYTVDGATLNASLVASSKDLNEVVVTALGIRKEKKALGYSVTEIKGEDLTQARSVNIANSLVGKVAGLNISQTATGLGGSTRITIRGDGSINGNNQPLIVVDGTPMNNDNLGSAGMWAGMDKGDGISSLNADEIETVTVLKGGTAAALYGSRASNGAILVTTKGGGKAKKGIGVEINSNIVAEDLLYKTFKDYQYDYGIGNNGVKPTIGTRQGNGANSFGGKLDGSMVPQFDGVSRPYVAQKNNLKNFYNTGTTLTNSVALFGASDKLSYRFSLSDLVAHGILPGNSLRRDNVAINLNAKLNERFSFLMNIKLVHEKNNNRPTLSDSPGNANYPMWLLPTSLDVRTLKTSKYEPNGFEKVWSDNQYVDNPWFAANDYIQYDYKDRAITTFEPRMNITNWLYLKGRFGADYFQFRNTQIVPTGNGYLPGGQYNTNLRNFTETNVELLLGVNKQIAKNISLNGIIGGNLMKQQQRNDNYGGLGNNGPFNIPFFYDISNTNASNIATQFNYVEQRINSVYASADLAYKNYLYLTLTGRNDWFSTLSPKNNNIFYPSVGTSFILSDALTLPSFINYSKIRASWAQVGGAGISPYSLSLYYQLSGSFNGIPLGQINGSQVPNASLQPYTSTTFEIGYESRMFNNRFNIDVAVYSRKTTKEIIPASISNASGYTTALFNIGELSNKGIEALISYKIIANKNFGWELSMNGAYNKSRVEKLYGNLPELNIGASDQWQSRTQTAFIYQRVGSPFSLIEVIPFIRDPKSGSIVFAADGRPKLDGSLRKIMGPGISPYQIGITNSFTFNKLTFSFLVDGKFGGYLHSGTAALATNRGLMKTTLPGREGGVVGVGVNEAGTPNTVNVEANRYYSYLSNFGEPFVYKSDFIKLRQIIIGYTIPLNTIGKVRFQSATVSLVGRNLLTLMKDVPVIDPESTYNIGNNQGLEFAGMPATRTIGLNLNLKF